MNGSLNIRFIRSITEFDDFDVALFFQPLASHLWPHHIGTTFVNRPKRRIAKLWRERLESGEIKTRQLMKI